MTLPANLRCPKCGSDDLAEIVYGPVEMTDDLLALVQVKKILLRNDPPPGNRPKYYCFHCGYEW